ncbi:MAG: iron-containing redox enzyme family protein [Nitrospirae bacterium]|nr:iron-containing redox enzyme family protein [Nitrospirota bacterium]
MTPSQFKEELLSLMERKDHWAWKYFSQEKLSKEQLKVHFKQEYAVYVRDFPVFLGRVYAKNPPMEVRYELVQNIYEEETGGISKTGPHPVLFLKMMAGLGFKRSEFQIIEMLPASRTYRQWIDEVTLHGEWYEGAAVTGVFVEGSVKDRKELESVRPVSAKKFEEVLAAHPMVRVHGVAPENMDLIKAHIQVEGSHRKAAWQMVLDYVDTDEKRKKVKDAMQRTLDLWLAYRDGVADACELKRDM